MTKSSMSIGLALLVSAAIALMAFMLGQAVEGAGMIVAILGSSLWVAYSVARQRRHERRTQIR